MLEAACMDYHIGRDSQQLGTFSEEQIRIGLQDGSLRSTDLAPDILQRWNDRPVGVPAATGPLVHVRLDQTLAQAVRELEEQFIDHALASTGGRITEAAGILGLSRKGLFLKRRRRGLVGGRPDVLP